MRHVERGVEDDMEEMERKVTCHAPTHREHVDVRQQGGRGGIEASRAHLRSLPAEVEAPAKGRGGGLE